MKRVLFLEDDGLSRSAPYLEGLGHRPVAIRTGVYDRWHRDETLGLGIETIRLPAEATALALLAAARKLRPDAVVSLALLEGECLRDAMVADFLRSTRGVPTVASPPAAVLLATDKLATKCWLAADGVPVSEAVEVPDLTAAEAAAERFGYPLVLKRRDGYTGAGLRYIEGPKELERFYRRRPAALIAEAFIEGIELSVEVLRWNEATLPLTVVGKGATRVGASGTHPMYRLRVAPADLPATTTARVLDLAARAVASLGLVGTAECEFILHPRRGPLLLEVNPRISGTTPLSSAASGIDVHCCLADMAIGACDLARPLPEAAVAAQVPVSGRLDEPLIRELEECEQVRSIKRIDWVPQLGISGSLTIAERSFERLAAFLDCLGNRLDLGTAAEAIARQADRAVAGR